MIELILWYEKLILLNVSFLSNWFTPYQLVLTLDYAHFFYIVSIIFFSASNYYSNKKESYTIYYKIEFIKMQDCMAKLNKSSILHSSNLFSTF